jgi:hypothetical protein
VGYRQTDGFQLEALGVEVQAQMMVLRSKRNQSSPDTLPDVIIVLSFIGLQHKKQPETDVKIQ